MEINKIKGKELIDKEFFEVLTERGTQIIRFHGYGYHDAGPSQTNNDTSRVIEYEVDVPLDMFTSIPKESRRTFISNYTAFYPQYCNDLTPKQAEKYCENFFQKKLGKKINAKPFSLDDVFLNCADGFYIDYK